MKKMDEMDRNIKLHSESLGYKAALICLALWTLCESWQTLANNGQSGYSILPMTILMAALCVQWFSEMAMKRKMISGDDEYKEPNKILRSVITIIVITAIIISIGSYLMLKLN